MLMKKGKNELMNEGGLLVCKKVIGQKPESFSSKQEYKIIMNNINNGNSFKSSLNS